MKTITKQADYDKNHEECTTPINKEPTSPYGVDQIKHRRSL